MTDQSVIAPRTINMLGYHQACLAAIEEALDSLHSLYWAHSFDEKLLRRLVLGVMLPIIEGAIPLSVSAWDETNDVPTTPVRVYPSSQLRDSLVSTCIKEQQLVTRHAGNEYPCPLIGERRPL